MLLYRRIVRIEASRSAEDKALDAATGDRAMDAATEDKASTIDHATSKVSDLFHQQYICICLLSGDHGTHDHVIALVPETDEYVIYPVPETYGHVIIIVPRLVIM